MNSLKLKEKGLQLTYKQSCSTSWLELEVIDFSKKIVDQERPDIRQLSKLVVEKAKSTQDKAPNYRATAYLSGSSTAGHTADQGEPYSERDNVGTEMAYLNIEESERHHRRGESTQLITDVKKSDQ